METSSEDVLERFRLKLGQYRSRAEKEQDERYALCDEINHVSPYTPMNKCFYCDRHLDYGVFDDPEEQEFKDQEKGLFKIMLAMREGKI